MKKHVVAAIAALAFTFNANAQLGIVAGVNSMSTDIESAIATYKSITDYHAGLVYRLNLPLGFSIQPGLLYNMKGQALEGQIKNLEAYKVNVEMKTGYLQVPVRVGWGFDVAGLIQPFVFAEPYAGYAITTEAKTRAADAAQQAVFEKAAGALGLKLDTSNSDADKWDGRSRIEYGVSLGAGITVLKRVSVSAKYIWDMGQLFLEGSEEDSWKEQASVAARAMAAAVKDKKCSGISASLILYF